MTYSEHHVRRGSPDPADATDRRSPAPRETFGHALWLGQETGHNTDNQDKQLSRKDAKERREEWKKDGTLIRAN
jgi:hypothetical protein